MQIVKKISLGLMVLGLFSLFFFQTSELKAETITASICRVNTQEDNPGAPHPRSLRGSVEDGFNRQGTGRACTEQILFYGGASYTISLHDTIDFTNDNDVDSDGDGNNLIVDGTGATVVIDATAMQDLDPSKCAFHLKNSKSIWKNMTLRVRDANKAFCDDGNNNHHTNGENGLVIQVVSAGGGSNPTPACNMSDPCCETNQETGITQWKETGSACTQSGVIDGHCDASHACKGDHADCEGDVCCHEGTFVPEATECQDPAHGITHGSCDGHGSCVPTPVDQIPDCIAGSPCCDSSGHFQDSTVTCTDPNGDPGTCNGHGSCISNVAPECVPSVECCNFSGHYMDEGSPCDDGHPETTDDKCVAHHCVGTPASTGGDHTGDGSNNNDNSGNNGNQNGNPDQNSNTCSGKVFTISMKNFKGETITKSMCSSGGCSLSEMSLSNKAFYFMILTTLVALVGLRNKRDFYGFQRKK